MSGPAVILRVREPSQAVRFYGDVLGFDVLTLGADRAQADLPGVVVELVRDGALETLHGAGAARHRSGVGVELRLAVADPVALAERVRTRGGFLVSATADATTVRDGDGYVWTFVRG